ncbi:hypothetical protein P22_0366 [Propionispora sp. 2/2-37]|uniref:hypothetical protein n=1 Tax=Propionispora sp. 2/2-37 TaxID=1677858 RepID=UPI0006BF3DD7|nr:hypothetical protein [Propionispora sp. 2/2-37]CUH94300.1 hypothetical protein P22_0366 [Propionispora sp. 2/2-37]
MEDWQKIKIDGVAFIEKCVAEFNVGELVKTPYSKFKVKIFERQNGTFIGFTNLQIKDKDGCPYAGVGHGETIEKALEDTIRYFFEMLEKKDLLTPDDFECVDPYDF